MLFLHCEQCVKKMLLLFSSNLHCEIHTNRTPPVRNDDEHTSFFFSFVEWLHLRFSSFPHVFLLRFCFCSLRQRSGLAVLRRRVSLLLLPLHFSQSKCVTLSHFLFLVATFRNSHPRHVLLTMKRGFLFLTRGTNCCVNAARLPHCHPLVFDFC